MCQQQELSQFRMADHLAWMCVGSTAPTVKYFHMSEVAIVNEVVE